MCKRLDGGDTQRNSWGQRRSQDFCLGGGATRLTPPEELKEDLISVSRKSDPLNK